MGNKEDKKVPFVVTNGTLLEIGANSTILMLTPPAGKHAFVTRVIATNMGAAAAADNLQLFDEIVSATGGTPANTLIPDVRVPYQSTVVVDLGDEGIPVATAVCAHSTTSATAFLIYDVALVGYYL